MDPRKGRSYKEKAHARWWSPEATLRAGGQQRDSHIKNSPLNYCYVFMHNRMLCVCPLVERNYQKTYKNQKTKDKTYQVEKIV